VEIKIHTGRRAFNAMSSISRKILKINYLHAHDFLNLGGLVSLWANVQMNAQISDHP